MNSKELIARLPDGIKKHINLLKDDYGKRQRNKQYNLINEVRAEMRGYCKGLSDAGALTEQEAHRLYIWLTI